MINYIKMLRGDRLSSEESSIVVQIIMIWCRTVIYDGLWWCNFGVAISSVLGEIRADTQENVLKSPHHKNTDIGRGFSITNVEEVPSTWWRAVCCWDKHEGLCTLYNATKQLSPRTRTRFAGGNYLEHNISNGQLSDVTGSANVMGRYLANAIVSDISKWRK